MKRVAAAEKRGLQEASRLLKIILQKIQTQKIFRHVNLPQALRVKLV